MAIKTLRNKAYKQSDQIIPCTYNGERWTSPSGYFAELGEVEYKPLKSQTDLRGNAPYDLNKIMEPNPKMVPVDTVVRVKPNDVIALDNVCNLGNKAAGIMVSVNSDYFDYLIAAWPNATVSVSPDPYSPVRFVLDNKLVAVIMPLRY